LGDRAHSPAELFSLVRPVMFTSSSLGDAIVAPPRRRLFEELVLARRRLAARPIPLSQASVGRTT
jgi:hypothetical protein